MRHIYSKIFLLFLVHAFLYPSCAKAKIDEAEITKFMSGYSSVMNRRSSKEIDSFFQSNAVPTARFIKNNTLVYADDSSPMMTENFDMNTSEFVEYLKKILIRHDVYRFTYVVNKIDFKDDNAFVNFSINEYYSKRYDDVEIRYEMQNLAISNCTMTLSTLNSQILIFGSNCIEKISKKRVFDNE